MGAKRQLAPGLAGVEAIARLEPLPVAVNQRNQRNRRVEEARRQVGDALESRFGRCVEDGVFMERAQTVIFVGRQGDIHC